MWGVRDHRSLADYGDAILGGRQAIPLMLDMFRHFGIHATWATVGALFARNRDEMLAFAPEVRPQYTNPRLSPYPAMETQIGTDEREDPYHFGRSLLDQIAETPGQEIATHTFGHIYALEPGMTGAAWQADLQAAQAIADHAGHHLRSIVFPRNQFDARAIDHCQQLGLDCYRGNPPGWVYDPRPGDDLSAALRMARFLDGALPLFGGMAFDAPASGNGISDVPASRFLRPWNARFPLYSRLHQTRVIREMTAAARSGQCYHLWWHPHNMGRDTAQNMAQLTAILRAFDGLRDRFGFESVTMAQCVPKGGA